MGTKSGEGHSCQCAEGIGELDKSDPRLKSVEKALKRFRYQPDALIEVLHTAQEAYGYLDLALLTYVSEKLDLPPSWVFGVATFYHFFSLEPQGEHSCIVCMGTACYVKAAGEIVERVEEEYGIRAGETTPDGKLSLHTARCLGSCGLAPLVLVDGEVLGRVGPEEVLAKIQEKLSEEAAVPAKQQEEEAVA